MSGRVSQDFYDQASHQSNIATLVLVKTCPNAAWEINATHDIINFWGDGRDSMSIALFSDLFW